MELRIISTNANPQHIVPSEYSDTKKNVNVKKYQCKISGFHNLVIFLQVFLYIIVNASEEKNTRNLSRGSLIYIIGYCLNI